jgi:hypothetical protein
MKASQIYNTTQASNSQQILLYSNRSPVIIVLVRESRTKAPARERERAREREQTTTSRSSKSKEHEEAEEAQQTAVLPCALVLPRSETKFSTFFLEAPNVLSGSFQRSFSTFPGFFLHAPRLCSFPHCSLPTFFLAGSSLFPGSIRSPCSLFP